MGKLEYDTKIQTRPLEIGRWALVELQPLPSGRMGCGSPCAGHNHPRLQAWPAAEGGRGLPRGCPGTGLQPGRLLHPPRCAAHDCRHYLQPGSCCTQLGGMSGMRGFSNGDSASTSAAVGRAIAIETREVGPGTLPVINSISWFQQSNNTANLTLAKTMLRCLHADQQMVTLDKASSAIHLQPRPTGHSQRIAPIIELASDAVRCCPAVFSIEEPAVLILRAMLPRLLPVSRLGTGLAVLRIETAALWPLTDDPVSLSSACVSGHVACVQATLQSAWGQRLI